MNREHQAIIYDSTNRLYLKILISYFAFEYVRFQSSFLPFLSPLKISMLLFLAITVIFMKSKKDVLKDALFKLMCGFTVLLICHVPFAVNNFFAYHAAKSMVMNLVVVASTMVILRDRGGLTVFLKGWVVINALVAVWVITHGGKGTGGFLVDENDAALLMNTAFPFGFYLSFLHSNSKFEKFCYQFCALLFVVAVVVSSSRGGLLGFSMVAISMLIISGKPLRNFSLVFVSTVIFSGFIVALLPAGYIDEMNSMYNPDDSTRVARLLHWTTAWEIMKDNFLLGVGGGNYPWTSTDYFHLSPYYFEGMTIRSGRMAHSLYFTLLPETGLLGTVIFIAILAIFFGRMKKIRKFFDQYNRGFEPSISEVSQEFSLFSKMMVGSVVGYLGTGIFISVLYYPIFWSLISMSIVLWYAYISHCTSSPCVIAQLDN